MVGLLYGYTGVSVVQGMRARDGGRVVVGAKTFTEQYILSEILAGQIEETTGADTEVVSSLGSTVAFDALRAGEIDVYVDYSGTIWATIMRRDGAAGGRDEVLGEVRQFLSEQHGIETVGALGFENAYALAMRRRQAEEAGIRSISDLTRARAAAGDGRRLRILRTAGVVRHPRHVRARLLATQRTMDPSLMYQAAGERAGGRDQRLLDRRTDRRVRSAGARRRARRHPAVRRGHPGRAEAGPRAARRRGSAAPARGDDRRGAHARDEPGRGPGWHEPRNGGRGVPSRASRERRSTQSSLSTQRQMQPRRHDDTKKTWRRRSTQSSLSTQSKCNHEDTKTRKDHDVGRLRRRGKATADHGRVSAGL